MFEFYFVYSYNINNVNEAKLNKLIVKIGIKINAIKKGIIWVK